MPANKSQVRFLITCLALAWGFFATVGQVSAQWSGPTSTPPGGQPLPFVSTDSTSQTKAGDFLLGSNFTVTGANSLTNILGFLGAGTNATSSAVGPRLLISPNSNSDISIDAGTGAVRSSHTAVNNNDLINKAYLDSTSLNYWLRSGNNLYTTSTITNVGIGTTSPSSKLHLVNTNGGDGTWIGGLTIENTSATAGEAAVNFKNISTGANRWFTGINQGDAFDIAYGNGYTDVNSKIRILANGRVGIGTTSPAQKLHVAGSALISASGSGFPTLGSIITDENSKFSTLTTQVGSSAWMQLVSDSGALGISTGGTLDATRLVTFQSTGNVGIGTTNPSYKLQVVGAPETFGGIMGVRDITASATVTSFGGFRLSSAPGTDIYLGKYSHSTGSVADYQAFQIRNDSGTTLFHIDASTGAGHTSGNIGIGTTAPSQKLHVVGNSYFNGSVSVKSASQNAVVNIYGVSATTDYGAIQVSNLGGLTNPNNRALILQPNAGNVGIGTTNPGSYKLNVNGNTYFNGSAVFTGQVTVPTPTATSSAANKDYVDSIALSAQNALWSLNASNLRPSSTAWNVAIGTTSTPSAKLEVAGSFRVSGAASSVRLDKLAGTGGRIVMTDTEGNLYATSTSIATGIAVGTSGQTLRHDGTSWVANSVLYNNGTNIGIGTTNTGAKLDVLGTNSAMNFRVASPSGQIQMYNWSDNRNYIESTNASGTVSQLLYFTGYGGGVGTFAFNGGVGIGTTDPGTYKLSVNGTANFTGTASVAAPTADSHAVNKGYLTSALSAFNTSTNLWASSAAGIYNVSLGNVLVGTTTPSTHKFYVNGNTYLNGATHSAGNLSTSGTFSSASDIYTTGSGDDLWLGNGTQNSANFRAYATGETHIDADNIPLVFGEDQDAKIYYDSANLIINPRSIGAGHTIFNAGNVGIGATTSPSSPLTVVGTGHFTDTVTVAPPTADGHAVNKGYLTSALETFNSASNFWRLDGNNLYASSTAWNVGVGTISPSEKLDVAGDVSIQGSGGTIGGTSLANGWLKIGSSLSLDSNEMYFGTNGYIGTIGSYDLSFNTNNITRLIMKADGKIGIGTTNPTSSLDIYGGNVLINDATITSLTPKAAITKEYLDSSLSASGAALWATSSAGIYNTALDNVMVATTTMNFSRLNIQGGVAATGGYYAGNGAAGTPAYSFLSDTNTGMYRGGADTLRFSTAGADRMTIAANGTIGIGNTNPSGGKLQIYGEGESQGLNIASSTGDTFRLYRKNNVGYITRGGNDLLGLAIKTDGSVGIASTSPSYKLTVEGSGYFLDPVVVGSPAAGNHAATKNYVDSMVTGSYWRLSGSNLYASSTAWKVGIGTTSPDKKVVVQLDDAAGVDEFKIVDSAGVNAFNVDSDGNVLFGAYPANVNFNNANVTGMNNVAISDGGPQEGMTWADSTWSIDTSPLDRSNTTGNLNFYGTANNIAFWRPSLWVYNASNYTTATPQSNGGLNFITTGSGHITFNPGGLGFIGIGTTDPAYNLDVNGSARFTGQVTVPTPTATSSAVNRSYVDTNFAPITGAASLWATSSSGTYNTGLGNVMVGTTTMASGKLNVNGSVSISGSYRIGSTDVVTSGRLVRTANGTVGAPAYSFSNSTNTGMYSGGAGNLRLVTGGVDRITINSSGNVGVGTNAPQNGMKMDVRSDTGDGNSAITAYGYSGNGGIAIRGYGYATAGTGNNYGIMGESTGTRAAGTNIGGYFSATGALYNYALITGSGNVGIGSSTPGYKLSVNGTGHFNGTVSIAAPIADEHAVNKGYLTSALSAFNTSTNLWKYSDGNIYPSSTAWKVGIGTSTPSEMLEVVGKMKIGNNTVSGENVTFDGSTAAGMRLQNTYGYINLTPLNGGWAHIYTDRNNFIFNKPVYSGANIFSSYDGDLQLRRVGTTKINVGSTTVTIADSLTVNGTANSHFNGTVSVAPPLNDDDAVNKAYLLSSLTNDSFWKLSGSNLYASSTTWNVGIGTTNPISGFKTNISQDNAWPSDVTAGQLVLSGATAPSKRLVLGYDTTSNLGYIAAGNYGIAWSNLILQPSGGNVGIGITNPGSKLEVNGTVKLGGSAANVLLGLSANVANRSSLTLNSTSGNPADIIFKNGAATTGNYGQWTISSRNGDGGSYRFGVWRGSENGGVAGEKEVLSILPNGNGRVGIGTISPSVALDVSDGTGAVLDVSGGRITSVGNAVTSSDALSLGYAQGLFAPIGGAAAITLKAEDNRQISPSELSASTMKFGFTAYNNNNNSPYADFIHMRSYTDASGGRDNLLMFNKNSLGMRLYQQDFGSTTPYAAYKDVLLSDNSPVINHILKYTSNGTTVSAGKSQIFDNGTNVGIGTVSPTSPGGYTKSLHIQGGYASLILDSTTSAKKYEIGSSGAGGLDFYDGTAGAVRMTINTTGGGNFVGQFAVPTPTANSSAANKGYVDSAFTTYNNSSNYWRLTGNNLYSSSTAWSVGIGTASPGAKLDVVGSILSSGSRPVSIDGSAGNVFIKGDPGGWANGYNFYGSGGTNRGGFGAFGTADALSYYYIGTPYNNPTMTIKPGSGVGIGTTEPSAALQVVGNVTATQFNGSGAGLTGIASSLAAGYVDSPDGDRNANNKLPTTSGRKVRFDFASSWSTGTGGNYAGVMTYAPWDGTTASTGDASYQLAFGSTAINGSGIPQLRIRNGIDSTWNSWRSIILDDGSGNVGIGTTNPAGYKLNVNGIANFTGTVNVATPTANGHAATKAYVDDSFTVYNNSSNYWKLSGSNLYASSTDWKVGIGTNSPSAKLQINNQAAFNSTTPGPAAYYGLHFDGQTTSDYATGITWNGGTSGTQAGIYVQGSGSYGTKMYFATTNSYAIGAQTRMMIDYTGNVGIGTINPSTYKLSVNGTANFTGTVSVGAPSAASHAATKSYVDSVITGAIGTTTSAYVLRTGDTMTGDLNMGNKKILGVSKITVGTIDPLYDIKGIKYSTFASAIVGGVKEEYVGQGQIKNCNSQSCFWYLDFDQTKEGSDPWVWRQTIDFRPEKVEVLMTAQGLPTQMSYEFKDNGIIFHSEKPTKFSYRLIGARFDWREWPTKALDQTEKASLNIK